MEYLFISRFWNKFTGNNEIFSLVQFESNLGFDRYDAINIKYLNSVQHNGIKIVKKVVIGIFV